MTARTSPSWSGEIGARRAAAVLLVASLVMLALLVYVGRWLTFWSDEWSWLFQRPDPTVESLLGGSDVHLHLFPVLIYQVLFRLVGLGPYYPYLAVLWTFHLGCVALLFAVTGRIAGWGLGLVAGLSLLFLGSGFEVLLQPGQMGYTLSEATGLLALLLLTRAPDAPRARLGRVVAGTALCVGVASSGVGMIFVGLILVWAVLERNRANVAAALPALALYAAWFPLFAQRTTERLAPTFDGLVHLVSAVGYGVGATVTAVLGLPPYRFGVLGLAIAVVALGAMRPFGGRLNALAIGALAALVAEFVLVAGFRPSFGVTWGARSGYLHPAVAFLWIAAAAIWADPRFRPRSWVRPWMVAAVLALAILGNMAQFTGAARGMRILRASEVAYLRLVEALRDSGEVRHGAEGSFHVQPSAYLAAIDRFGAPRLLYREPTVTHLGYANPDLVDQALLRTVRRGIRLVPRTGVDGPAPDVAVTSGTAEPAGPACVRVVAGPTRATATWRHGGRLLALDAPAPAAVRALRLGVYASPRQAVAPELAAPAASGQALLLPALPAGLRWAVQLEVAAGESVTVCGGGTA